MTDRAADAVKAWIRFREGAAEFKKLKSPTEAAEKRLYRMFRSWWKAFEPLTKEEGIWCFRQGEPTAAEARGFCEAVSLAAAGDGEAGS